MAGGGNSDGDCGLGGVSAGSGGPVGNVGSGVGEGEGFAAWSREEDAILKLGVAKFKSRPSYFRYLKIARFLPKKTAREVATRTKWMVEKRSKEQMMDLENLDEVLEKKELVAGLQGLSLEEQAIAGDSEKELMENDNILRDISGRIACYPVLQQQQNGYLNPFDFMSKIAQDLETVKRNIDAVLERTSNGHSAFEKMSFPERTWDDLLDFLKVFPALPEVGFCSGPEWV